MKNLVSFHLIIVVVLFTFPVSAAEHDQLGAFPSHLEGKVRFVIELPAREQGEDNFKVELIPGRMMLTDGVNRTRLGVEVVPHPLKGWGYTYYEITGKDVAMSTMMAVPEGTEKAETFVQGAPLLIRYNSKLPVVIYVPEGKGYEVRYRIWKAGTTQKAVKK